MTSLDNLRKAAKRWLKALRAGDPEARARFARAYPRGPAEPALRDVQHALARERGDENWKALTARLAGKDAGGHAERVARFLQFATWDHHVHGKGNHRMYDRAAQRLLAQHPEIARDSIYTAVVSGEVAEARRILAGGAEAARQPGGPRGWTPILYLCYTRFTCPRTIENALAIAGALLDAGANPNDFYQAGSVPYTALVGVAGEGEQDSPRQPYAPELFQLLLERGAEPFDRQVLYNTHFSADMLWWLELVYAHTIAAGRGEAWNDPDWSMLNMGGYGPGAYFVLRRAITKNNRRLAEWALEHGASPNATSSHPKFKPRLTLYQEAVREGLGEMADLLVRYGAAATPATLSEEEQFVDACFRLDRDAVRAHVEKHPEYLRSTRAIFAAAVKDRADVVAFLLDLGVPIEIENEYKQRALHEAAAHNALGVAKLLIERGAEVDPRETQWDATPIGWAAHGDRMEMVRFLSQYTRNVWTLTFRGFAGRLREVLREQPDLAKSVASDGTTPLWWLPDDEATALEMADLLVAHGADPSKRSKEGTTAGDWARKRGMLDVASALESAGARR